MKITAIIPAHNESKRISSVLEVLFRSQLYHEVIVVDDQSSDNTLQILGKAFPSVRVIHNPKSRGKGFAMTLGAKQARSPVLFFCDADLIDLKEHHLHLLIKPVLSGELKMTVGAQEYMNPLKQLKIYRKVKKLLNNFGGNGRPYFNEFVKGMGGQRVIHKRDFLKIKNLEDSRYGVEQELNHYFIKNSLKFEYFILKNVSHYTKLEKWGLLGLLKDLDYLFTSSYHLTRRLWVKFCLFQKK